MDHVKDLLAQLYAAEPHVETYSRPEDVVLKLLPLRDKKVEQFVVLLVDNKNRLMGKRVVSRGTVDQTPVYPREIFRFAIQKQASGVILGHNHPGGDPAPSVQDHELTKRIVHGGQVLDIRVLDHIIVAKNGHFSFQAQGLL